MRLLDRIARRSIADQTIPEDPGWGSFWSMWRGEGVEPVLQVFADYAARGYSGDSVVFACILKRIELFSQAELKWQDLTTRRLFGTPGLSLLERPWPGGTTADLLARMEQDVSLSGNAFVWRASPDRLVRLRPDCVDVATIEIESPDDSELEWPEVSGYVWWPEGRGRGDPAYLPVADVAHWTPIPDPLADWRGMSWLTPVVREVNSDISMTQHKRSYFANGATPGLLVRYQRPVAPEQLAKVRVALDAAFRGVDRAGKTIVVDEGAEVMPVGSTLAQADLRAVQGATETRICMAAGVPPIIIGSAEGLAASTYSNYESAHKAFANSTIAHNWQSACAALAKLVDTPTGAELWYDSGAIPALQEAETARAEAAHVNAQALSVLITAGFDPVSAQDAIAAGDVTLLRHSGLVSVQLQQPGQVPTAGGAAA